MLSSATSIGRLCVVGACVALAFTGLATKYRRYAAPRPSAVEWPRQAQAIGAFVAQHAWTPASIPGDGRETFAWLAFAKPGCRQPLIVAALPAGAELQALARAIYGDVAFVQRNRVGVDVDATLDRLRRAAFIPFVSALAEPGAASVLAVHPSPPEVASACSPPSAADWLAFVDAYDGQRRTEPPPPPSTEHSPS